MNKHGESNSLVWIIIAVIGVYFLYTSGFFSGLGGSGSQYISTGATTLVVSSTDAAQSGTAVGSTAYTKVNDNAFTTGITTASPGQTLNMLLLNGTTYHSAYVTGLTVPQAPTFPIPVKLNANATSITVTAFNNNNVAMNNGGGATNQTVATGGAYTMALSVDGQDLTSTQDMRCIVEASDTTKIDKLSLSGFGANLVSQSKPNWYTLSGTSAGVWVYDVNPIAGVGRTTGSITAQSKSGQSMSGKYFKITCYTKEYFLDSYTGAVSYNVEDSRGNLKSIASYGFTGYFT